MSLSRMRNSRFSCTFLIAVLIFSAFIWPVHVYAQGAHDGRKHFLWSVTAGKGTLYLLGSIHILRRDSYPLPEQIEDAYKCCSTLVFEADPDSMKDRGMQKIMTSMALFQGARTLRQEISSDTYARLGSKLAKEGLAPSAFDRFRPWFAAQSIASSELVRLGFDPQAGIDRYFFERAKKDNKEILFLETAVYQMNLLAGLDRQSQEDVLSQILKDLDIAEKNFSKMTSYWKTGDVSGLGGFIMDSFADYPQLYKRIVLDRNRKWASRIQRYLRQDRDILMIVGAAHLAGKGSLVELLQKKGYRVRQM